MLGAHEALLHHPIEQHLERIVKPIEVKDDDGLGELAQALKGYHLRQLLQGSATSWKRHYSIDTLYEQLLALVHILNKHHLADVLMAPLHLIHETRHYTTNMPPIRYHNISNTSH